MTYAPGIGFTDNFKLYPDQGLEGMLVDSFPHNVLTLKNSAKSATAKARITIGTASTNLYSLTFESLTLGLPLTTVTVTPTGTPTAADVQNLLMDALRGNLMLTSRLKFTKVSTTAIDAISRVDGKAGAFTITASGGGSGFAGATTTQGADAPIIPWGRLLWTRNTAKEGDECSVIDGPLASGIVRGVSVLTEAYGSYGDNVGSYGYMPGYPPNYPVNCAKMAQIWMYALTDMEPYNSVHAYITGDHQGRVRATADGANTTDISSLNLKPFNSIKANTIGRFEVNL